MRFLPALVAGSRKAWLPLCETSAECLSIAVLDSGPGVRDTLLRQLWRDPALAVWAACVAWAADRLRPQSMAELAAWLLGRLPGVLCWEDGVAPCPMPTEPAVERFAARVLADLQLAELAAQLATLDGKAPAESVRFRGLLAHAPQWLELAALDPANPPLACLPDWLGEDPAVLCFINQAVSMLAGSTPPQPRLDLERCLQQAEEGRRRWLSSSSPLAEHLPQLVAKMSRLAELEHRFQESLETEKLAAMAELAAGAGHEINNPLAIIAGRAQLLLAEETDSERRRELAVINAQVKRAHEMIADMRLFARPPRPERRPFDLTSLLDTVVEELASQAADRAIRVERSGEAGPLELEADPAQLEVVLRAMGKNALELIAHGGLVQFQATQVGDEVCIRVSDNGPGITPEQRRHLFDPFFSARQAGRGLGLGLSKCWRIITNHGGRIEVQSQPGQGATFAIFLPQHGGDSQLSS